MKKIAILYNLNRGKYEYETEFDSELTINSIYNSLKEKYETKMIEAVKDFSWINELKDFKPDLVFNICEGFNGPARESVYGAILEQLNINYSGPDSTNLLICHNKFLVKNLISDICDVPKGYSITKIDDIKKLKDIKYPIIVKLNSEGSSMGLSNESIVQVYNQLEKQTMLLLKKYRRNILLEEYIDGQDISMIFIEGIGALGPCIVKCDSLFYDYEMKSTKDCEVDIEPIYEEFTELKKIVEKIAKRLDIKGYAKMDFRIRNGKYYLIEVNSQVSFHPDGEFITCAKKEGYKFNEIINYIVEYASKYSNKPNSIGINKIGE